MFTAHKIALKPNNEQITYFKKACESARVAYNWGLMQWNKQYEAWEKNKTNLKPNEFAILNKLNSIIRKEFPWMIEVTQCAREFAIKNLGMAFKNYYNNKAKHPRLHKVGEKDRFSISKDKITISGKKLHIENLGPIRMMEQLRFNGKIISATISREANRWYVSITVMVANLPKRPKLSCAVGVDLGVKTQATLSNGDKELGPKARQKLISRIKRLSNSHSRKQEGSKNQAKAKMKLDKIRARISHIRNDALHKLTTKLTRNFGIIGIEELKVKEMIKNPRIAGPILDSAFYEFRRQLEYKADRLGDKVIVANRWFASSKRCSACGYTLNELPLSVRHWTCPKCGTKHERDLNAAINLRNFAVNLMKSA